MIAINTFAINGATPDLTLLMDVEVATGFDRIATRQRELFQKSDRIEREARAFHERVRRGYLELAARWPARFRTINAARDPGEVEADVWKWVQQLLG
jgi:dTMP kinase